MTLSMVQFNVSTPRNEDELGANIQHALSLGLRQVDELPIKTLTVIANGPSARRAPFKRLAKSKAPVVCMNGALGLCLSHGLIPTYWIACDPQPGIADFIPDNPPSETIYIVASKCDPSVFAKLRGRDVRLWHIKDHPLVMDHRPIRVASTVTLTALTLFRRLGFRHFDIWGWDACYGKDLTHHASDAPMTERKPDDIDLIIGAERDETAVNGFKPNTGRKFHTTKTWALEAQDAVFMLAHADYSLKLHGDGMIKAITGF